eukprot:g23487.t1
MEHCVQFWSPHYRKDVITLEKVQRKFAQMLPEMKSLSYEERLDKLGLFFLQQRKLRGHLIEVYKIMTGIDIVDHENLFLMADLFKTKGYKFK